MKKIPDSFVPDRKNKEYPTEIGSQKFSPDDIALFKLASGQKVKKYYTQKFSELAAAYESLLSEISTNEMLYAAKINFEPIVGSTYYLYKSTSGNFLSLLSPDEWGKQSIFIGKFQLLSDDRWQQL